MRGGMQDFFNALGDSYDNVIFNFYEATALTISGITVEGSILAPLAQVTAYNGNINGTVIAQSLTTWNMSLNNRPFESIGDAVAPTPVPEPGTLVLFSCSLLFFSSLLKRKCSLEPDA